MLTACLSSTAPLPPEQKAGGLRLFASTPPEVASPQKRGITPHRLKEWLIRFQYSKLFVQAAQKGG